MYCDGVALIDGVPSSVGFVLYWLEIGLRFRAVDLARSWHDTATDVGRILLPFAL